MPSQVKYLVGGAGGSIFALVELFFARVTPSPLLSAAVMQRRRSAAATIGADADSRSHIFGDRGNRSLERRREAGRLQSGSTRESRRRIEDAILWNVLVGIAARLPGAGRPSRSGGSRQRSSMSAMQGKPDGRRARPGPALLIRTALGWRKGLHAVHGLRRVPIDLPLRNVKWPDFLISPGMSFDCRQLDWPCLHIDQHRQPPCAQASVAESSVVLLPAFQLAKSVASPPYKQIAVEAPVRRATLPLPAVAGPTGWTRENHDGNELQKLRSCRRFIERGWPVSTARRGGDRLRNLHT
jgi:hypothetical protein